MSGRRRFLQAITGSVAGAAVLPVGMALAGQAGPPPGLAVHDDAAVLDACVRFMDITREVDRLNVDPACEDAELTAALVAWHEAVDVVTNTRAWTAEGMCAKASVTLEVFRLEVPNFVGDTVEGCAGFHELLAWRLAHDMVG